MNDQGVNLFGFHGTQANPIINQVLALLGQRLSQAMFPQSQAQRIVPKVTPTAMPTATPTSAPIPYQPNITIPYSQGGQYTLQPQTAQPILNAFNDINQATNAAQVLNHPYQQTYNQQEIKKYGHPSYNYGENASFKTQLDAPNADGSIDRGLFRVNSNTFNGVMAHPYWGKVARQKFGINSWDDMNDPQKNAYMAKIIYEQGGWGRWFAAPQQLRQQGAPDLNQLDKMIQK